MATKKQTEAIDFASVGGLALGLGGILGGLMLEKGSIKDIAQVTAGIIVLGGTAGAVLLSTPLPTCKKALGALKTVFFHPVNTQRKLIDEIVIYATKARKQGIISLEGEATAIRDPFLKKALNLAVDGTDLDDLRSMMELDIDVADHETEEVAKVFDSGGGFAPTIGIIGAVLGLIQVMKNLANIEEVGHGIAVAFVATVYGVALANLFLLPVAGKIRARAAREKQMRELALTGVIGIVEGMNPKLIRVKLNAYLNGSGTEPAANKPQTARAA